MIRSGCEEEVRGVERKWLYALVLIVFVAVAVTMSIFFVYSYFVREPFHLQVCAGLLTAVTAIICGTILYLPGRKLLDLRGVLSAQQKNTKTLVKDDQSLVEVKAKKYLMTVIVEPENDEKIKEKAKKKQKELLEEYSDENKDIVFIENTKGNKGKEYLCVKGSKVSRVIDAYCFHDDRTEEYFEYERNEKPLEEGQTRLLVRGNFPHSVVTHSENDFTFQKYSEMEGPFLGAFRPNTRIKTTREGLLDIIFLRHYDVFGMGSITLWSGYIMYHRTVLRSHLSSRGLKMQEGTDNKIVKSAIASDIRKRIEEFLCVIKRKDIAEEERVFIESIYGEIKQRKEEDNEKKGCDQEEGTTLDVVCALCALTSTHEGILVDVSSSVMVDIVVRFLMNASTRRYMIYSVIEALVSENLETFGVNIDSKSCKVPILVKNVPMLEESIRTILSAFILSGVDGLTIQENVSSELILLDGFAETTLGRTLKVDSEVFSNHFRMMKIFSLHNESLRFLVIGNSESSGRSLLEVLDDTQYIISIIYGIGLEPKRIVQSVRSMVSDLLSSSTGIRSLGRVVADATVIELNKILLNEKEKDKGLLRCAREKRSIAELARICREEEGLRGEHRVHKSYTSYIRDEIILSYYIPNVAELISEKSASITGENYAEYLERTIREIEVEEKDEKVNEGEKFIESEREQQVHWKYEDSKRNRTLKLKPEDLSHTVYSEHTKNLPILYDMLEIYNNRCEYVVERMAVLISKLEEGDPDLDFGTVWNALGEGEEQEVSLGFTSLSIKDEMHKVPLCEITKDGVAYNYRMLFSTYEIITTDEMVRNCRETQVVRPLIGYGDKYKGSCVLVFDDILPISATKEDIEYLGDTIVEDISSEGRNTVAVFGELHLRCTANVLIDIMVSRRTFFLDRGYEYDIGEVFPRYLKLHSYYGRLGYEGDMGFLYDVSLHRHAFIKAMESLPEREKEFIRKSIPEDKDRERALANSADGSNCGTPRDILILLYMMNAIEGKKRYSPVSIDTERRKQVLTKFYESRSFRNAVIVRAVEIVSREFRNEQFEKRQLTAERLKYIMENIRKRMPIACSAIPGICTMAYAIVAGKLSIDCSIIDSPFVRGEGTALEILQSLSDDIPLFERYRTEVSNISTRNPIVTFLDQITDLKEEINEGKSELADVALILHEIVNSGLYGDKLHFKEYESICSSEKEGKEFIRESVEVLMRGENPFIAIRNIGYLIVIMDLRRNLGPKVNDSVERFIDSVMDEMVLEECSFKKLINFIISEELVEKRGNVFTNFLTRDTVTVKDFSVVRKVVGLKECQGERRGWGVCAGIGVGDGDSVEGTLTVDEASRSEVVSCENNFNVSLKRCSSLGNSFTVGDTRCSRGSDVIGSGTRSHPGTEICEISCQREALLYSGIS